MDRRPTGLKDYPQLLKEWHPEKNGKLSPNDVSPGSKKIVWWICESGHEWQAAVRARVGWPGCPVCTGGERSPKPSLRTEYPEIADQWHPEKNGDLTPDNVTSGSGRKVWWICERGHEWQNSVVNRRAGSRCPYCSGRLASPDYNLRSVCPDIAQEWHPEKNGDLNPEDVTPGSGKKVWWMCKRGHEWQAEVYYRSREGGCPYCSGRRASAERNLRSLYPHIAEQWHPEKNGDLTPEEVPPGSGKRVWWKCKCGHEWQTVVWIRTGGSDCPMCARSRATQQYNLRSLYPDIASEWHQEKNAGLTPEEVTPGSERKFWWKCKYGHVWRAAVFYRARGHGCPKCAGKIPARNKNLRARFPEIANEWHPAKNGELTPKDVAPRSSKMVWWKCQYGHVWQARVRDRTKGTECPVCAGGRTPPDVNLRVQFPEIADEWHPEKNGDLTPYDVTSGSPKKVWWKCKYGHEWQTTVRARKKDSRCPICARRWPSSDRNLQVRHPEIAREWHPEKNGNLTPEAVSIMSNRKVWWKCRLGHEWQTRVSSRVRFGSGCPQCRRKRIRPDHSLSNYPHLVQEWHPEKNGSLTPANYSPGRSKKVWWKGKCGHEWMAAVRHRKNGAGCPICTGSQADPERNLRVTHPEIAREWHPENNGSLTPEDLTPESRRNIWWKCKCGHEWKSPVRRRTSSGTHSRCPQCARKRTEMGTPLKD